MTECEEFMQFCATTGRIVFDQELFDFWKALKTSSAQRIVELEQQIAEMTKGEPVAWMYPSDLKKFESSETFVQAFSIKVGCPDEEAIPLFSHSVPAGMQIVPIEPTDAILFDVLVAISDDFGNLTDVCPECSGDGIAEYEKSNSMFYGKVLCEFCGGRGRVAKRKGRVMKTTEQLSAELDDQVMDIAHLGNGKGKPEAMNNFHSLLAEFKNACISESKKGTDADGQGAHEMSQLDEDFPAKAPYLTKIAQLEALIDELQHALGHIVWEPDNAAVIAQEVLQRSPAQSLMRYRNQILEEVAIFVEPQWNYFLASGEEFAEAIRNMKEVE